ncbi:Y4qI [Bradyrhizobium japonicum SEMIA 5079]|uniref:ID426 n=2 Tax=Bradyrhizobium TaxID=374 RepID=Q9AN91_BRAJP|nr:ID426 [Bradyrhizobium japonicum]AHY48585.1 Y4qI [Bradyrhizobium japonicum SEMIA 5079]KGJ71559.1 putative transposase [Bradyrhizobium diazoefficiens SEMIA 5080]
MNAPSDHKQLRERIASLPVATAADEPGRTIATLLQTAKMNNVDPCAWLSLTPQRIANGWPSGEIDALMPWNHAA